MHAIRHYSRTLHTKPRRSVVAWASSTFGALRSPWTTPLWCMYCNQYTMHRYVTVRYVRCSCQLLCHQYHPITMIVVHVLWCKQHRKCSMFCMCMPHRTPNMAHACLTQCDADAVAASTTLKTATRASGSLHITQPRQTGGSRVGGRILIPQ